MSEKPIVSFRIRADIRDGLKKLAEADRRSLSQYVENVLEDHLKIVPRAQVIGTQ